MPRSTPKSAGDHVRRKAPAVKARNTDKASAMADAADAIPDAAMDMRASAGQDTAIDGSNEMLAALMLPDCLDSAATPDLKDMFMARRGNAIIIDASQVRRVGVQSLQVLVAAARTWRSEGLDFRLENPSAELIETIALVGLPREELQIEGMPQ